MSISPFNWIRDLFGIRKDLAETKKVNLEFQRLKDEELARNLLQTATFAEIQRYDHHIHTLMARIIAEEEIKVDPEKRKIHNHPKWYPHLPYIRQFITIRDLHKALLRQD